MNGKHYDLYRTVDQGGYTLEIMARSLRDRKGRRVLLPHASERMAQMGHHSVSMTLRPLSVWRVRGKECISLHPLKGYEY